MTALPINDNDWLPERCPSWCDNGHAEILVETGDWSAAQKHYAYGGEGHCSEMRNSVSGLVTRPGGASWHLHAEVTPMVNGGYASEETIHLEARSTEERNAIRHAILPLTSGEARILARQLLHLADKLDLR